MFQTVCGDFVNSVCGGVSAEAKVGYGETVLASVSVDVASRVKVGTFSIEQISGRHFWQKTNHHIMLDMLADIDERRASTERMLLQDFNKEIDMSTKSKLDISVLKQIGVNVGMDYEYKMCADLGQINRIDLNRDSIKNYKVPAAVSRELKSTVGGWRKKLCIVTSVFTVVNTSTIKLIKDFKVCNKLEVAKVTNESEDNSVENSRVNSMKLVPGQIIACSVQEVQVDSATGTFYFPFQEKPLSSGKGKIKKKTAVDDTPAGKKEVAAASGGSGDQTGEAIV